MNIIPLSELNSNLRMQFLEGTAIHWGSQIIVSLGKSWDVAVLDGFAAVEEDHCLGAITWRLEGDEMEIVTLYSTPRKSGTGSLLMNAAVEAGVRLNIKRIFLTTSNDNIDAIRFYQRRGFRLAALHRRAIDEARLIKPDIPISGSYGIEIHDEIEMEMRLV